LACPLEFSTTDSNAGLPSLSLSGHSDHQASWFDILDFDCLDSLLYHGLASFEYASPPEPLSDAHLVQNILFYDLDDDDGSVIEPSINIIQDPVF